MCLILFAVDPAPDVALILAANRDEEHARPALPAHAWQDVPGIVGGRDERAGGTWLGIDALGRLAALTNVRHPGARREGRSRGELALRYLRASARPERFAEQLAPELRAYPSFNLLLHDPGAGTFVLTEEGSPPARAAAGVHGLSNARLDTGWPKVRRGRELLAHALTLPEPERIEALMDFLRDERVAADAELPSTGVPLELERRLSAPFIRSSFYGTRCSTVVTLRRTGQHQLVERSFDAEGQLTGTVALTFGP